MIDTVYDLSCNIISNFTIAMQYLKLSMIIESSGISKINTK